MRSTPSLSSFLGPLLPGMVAPDRALFMGLIKLIAYLYKTELFELELFV